MDKRVLVVEDDAAMRELLETAGGNETMAARILGLDRRTLYRKLDRWVGSAGG